MASFSDDKVGGMHKASSFQVSLDIAAGCPLRPEGKTETSLYAILQPRPHQTLAWEQLWYTTTDAMLVFFKNSNSSPFSKTVMNNIQNKMKDKRHLRGNTFLKTAFKSKVSKTYFMLLSVSFTVILVPKGTCLQIKQILTIKQYK